jgi:uncharacterized protein
VNNAQQFMASCLLAMGTTVVLAQSASTPTGLSLDLVDSGIVQKQVISWRTKKFEGIVAQQMDYSCGASVVATVLTYGLGKPISETQAIEGMLTRENQASVMQRGFSMLDMKKYVESIGFKASGFKVEPAKLLDLKIPVITLITQNGVSHFVVIKKASDARVYLADPARGHRVVPMAEFQTMWSGLVLAVLGGRGFLNDSDITKEQMGALRWRTAALHELANLSGGEHVLFRTGQF